MNRTKLVLVIVASVSISSGHGCSSNGGSNDAAADSGSAGAGAAGTGAAGTGAAGTGAAGTGAAGTTGGAGGDGGAGGAPACRQMGQTCSQTAVCCPALNCIGTCSIGVSDRNAKRDFAPVDNDHILESLSELPISTWRYVADETNARHLGPTAQDFKRTFGVGGSDKLILQVDADGVAFAAIQSLNARLNHLAADNAALRREIEKLRAEQQSSRSQRRKP